VLRGPDPTAFFAVNGLGQQLRLKCIGAGRLGPNGLNRYVASWAQLFEQGIVGGVTGLALVKHGN